MYLLSGIILLFLLLCGTILFTAHRRQSIRQVCDMSHEDKCSLLSSLIEPFGYRYDPPQDIISTLNDAWQRSLGYTSVFDRAAVSFHMVFDALPVYFDYNGRTYRIEFWKGQYGFSTGAEIGVYYADGIIPMEEYAGAHFHAVSDPDMLPMSFVLCDGSSRYAKMSGRTWWLTSFSPGCYSSPTALTLNAAIRFPNCAMAQSFLKGLSSSGFPDSNVCICGSSVQLVFDASFSPEYSAWQRFRRRLAQFRNRFSCFLYRRITRAFCLNLDRMLYLYFLLPPAFRKSICFRKYHGYSYRHCRHQ